MAPARAGALHRKKLSERIGRLEDFIDNLSKTPGSQVSSQDSKKLQALKNEMASIMEQNSMSRSISPNEDSTMESIEDQDSPRPRSKSRNSLMSSRAEPLSILDILTPSGQFKHQKICRILLKVLQAAPNVEESLAMHSHFWANNVRRQNPNATLGDIDVKEFAQRAVTGDNPIKIARVVQIAAAGAHDLKLFEQLVQVVDRLIVCDEEYMSSLEGLECAFEQGRFFVEMGQVRRSWLHTRKMISHLEVMGVSRTKAKSRSDWLWTMVYQTDKFLSLMVRSPGVVSDINSKVVFDNVETVTEAKPENGMMRLAILSGKVLEITKTTSSSYQSVLEVDQQLNLFSSQLPQGPLIGPVFPLKPQPPGVMKHAERNLMHLQLFQAKLMLHITWMLKSMDDPGLAYSRSSCFDAARGIIRIFKVHRKSEMSEKYFLFKTSPADWMAFIATAILIFGQMGYLNDPGQLAEDENSINSIIAIYREMGNNFATQSASVLKELKDWRDNPARDPTKSCKVTLPILGDIIIPGPSPTLKRATSAKPSTMAWVSGSNMLYDTNELDSQLRASAVDQSIYAPYLIDNSQYVQPLPFTETGFNLLNNAAFSESALSLQEPMVANPFNSYQARRFNHLYKAPLTLQQGHSSFSQNTPNEFYGL